IVQLTGSCSSVQRPCAAAPSIFRHLHVDQVAPAVVPHLSLIPQRGGEARERKIGAAAARLVVEEEEEEEEVQEGRQFCGRGRTTAATLSSSFPMLRRLEARHRRRRHPLPPPPCCILTPLLRILSSPPPRAPRLTAVAAKGFCYGNLQHGFSCQQIFIPARAWSKAAVDWNSQSLADMVRETKPWH
ncbi:hypothetical protein EJB05_57798, partial [Eragrostis curvula]